MKASGVIFGILIVAICLIMIISGIKSIIEKYKSNKRKRENDAKQKIDTLSSWEEEYNKNREVDSTKFVDSDSNKNEESSSNIEFYDEDTPIDTETKNPHE